MGWSVATRRAAGPLLILSATAACLSGPVPTPSPTAITASPSPTPSPVVRRICPTTQQLGGGITGRLGYPSDFLPPLAIYAIRVDGTAYRILHTVPVTRLTGTVTFTMLGLEPGPYIVVAYPIDSTGAITGGGLAGSYTPAVACGLSTNCTQHTPIRVTVKGGDTLKGVDLLDWYAPAGTFPAPPTGSEPYKANDRVAVCNPFADEVNLRAAAGIGGSLLRTISNGTELTVTDGPQPADGYDWYRVSVEAASGWVVAYALRR